MGWLGLLASFALGGGACVLAFVWLRLEVRRAFRAPIIAMGFGPPLGDAESYAYSAAWLVFALALLAAGILRRSAWPRHASLAVLLVTVVKVFLYDMRDLTGLWGVASFLGLGLALIGIGWLYRRYVFRTGDRGEGPLRPPGSPRRARS